MRQGAGMLARTIRIGPPPRTHAEASAKLPSGAAAGPPEQVAVDGEIVPSARLPSLSWQGISMVRATTAIGRTTR
jgi:hypothetical protein